MNLKLEMQKIARRIKIICTLWKCYRHYIFNYCKDWNCKWL